MNYKFVNPEYLEMVSGGDIEIIRELVGIFREQVAETNTEMKSLLEAKDYHSLGMLAHKAKSSAAIMGMENLAALLKTFELQAKEGKNSDQYESYISRFQSETEVALEELETWVNNR
jgi:HPt (histidine-containing phosphotransfer) domain-containing protein